MIEGEKDGTEVYLYCWNYTYEEHEICFLYIDKILKRGSAIALGHGLSPTPAISLAFVAEIKLIHGHMI